jgi:hypothetical protein
LVTVPAQAVPKTPSLYFAILNESQVERQQFMADVGLTTFENVYNPVSGKSRFRLSTLDRQSSGKMKKLEIVLDGQWQTLLK